MPHSFKIEFPPGTALLNVNQRNHWSKNAKVTAGLRQLSFLLARGITRLEKARIRATYYPPDNRRRDSSYVLYLSPKPIIDGIVDAGILSDDCDKYMRGLELLPGDCIVKGGQVVIEIIEVED